ncbi:MAG TPA: Rieske 2Fe-2S domain-containing protein [Chloroflexota bacterium]|nr:Rieske 2Fe-2S domain-containing protein [Chloroflexota bacterium]
MLTREENELLTRFGPGTPAGELLRRYWHPVAFAKDLTEDSPTRFVRIMGEDLVLFKDKSGNVGLMQDHCVHRGASMLYGRVEERGIACAYHGWLYDTKGNCLETPAEPADSKFYLTVKAKAYPVKKFIGMYWAYLGPLPAPEIPKIDVWVRRDGRRKIGVRPQLDCNWLQAMENSADSAHLQILHQSATGRGDPPTTTRGFIDSIASFDYWEYPFGLMKQAVYQNGKSDTHPLLFPNILRQGDGTHIRVPIDDTHTVIYDVRFVPSEDGSLVDDDEPEIRPFRPFKDPVDGQYPYATFRMDEVPAQDYMAWETQGPIADRTVERLATSDRGVVMYRQMLFREIERVRQGLDPMGVVRDPNHDVIETNLDESLEHMGLIGPGRRGQLAPA